jgi:RNA polymerase sigma-70 factor (ECF subfamily)
VEETAVPVDELNQLEDPPGEGPAAGPGPWVDLVERIRAGDSAAMEDLYRVFSRGIRYYLVRQLGNQEMEDRIHNAYVIVVQAIQAGTLREPARLMGFVKTVARRQVAAYIEEAVQMRKEHAELDAILRVADEKETPEEEVIRAEREQLMVSLLRESSERDREILTRFYVYNQTQEQICEEMDLSETQFRLLKSRAKSRLSESGRRHMARNSLQTLFVRKKAAGSH